MHGCCDCNGRVERDFWNNDRPRCPRDEVPATRREIEASKYDNTGPLLCPQCGYNLGNFSQSFYRREQTSDTTKDIRKYCCAINDRNLAHPSVSELVRNERTSLSSHENHNQPCCKSNVNRTKTLRGNEIKYSGECQANKWPKLADVVRREPDNYSRPPPQLSESRLYLCQCKIVQSMTQCWERFLQLQLGPLYQCTPKKRNAQCDGNQNLPRNPCSNFTSTAIPKAHANQSKRCHFAESPICLQQAASGECTLTGTSIKHAQVCGTEEVEEQERSFHQIRSNFESAALHCSTQQASMTNYQNIRESRSKALKRTAPQERFTPREASDTYRKNETLNIETRPNQSEFGKSNQGEILGLIPRYSIEKSQDNNNGSNGNEQQPFLAPIELGQDSDKHRDAGEQNEKVKEAISSDEKVQQWMEKNDDLGTSPRESRDNEPSHEQVHDELTIIQLGTSFDLGSGEKLEDESLHDQSYFRRLSLFSNSGNHSFALPSQIKQTTSDSEPPVPPHPSVENEGSPISNRTSWWH